MKIDFHSHILPGIDDGSKDIDESVQLLDIMAADGVDIVVATPHFYCTRRSIHRFLERRNKAYESLKPHLKPEHPKILLGAEVLYDDILIGKDALSRLTIEGTNFMLLEMPYTRLTEKHLEGVEKIVEELDVKVLVAHIERYLNFTSYKSLTDILDLEVLGQINAESLMHWKSRSNCFKLIKNGYVQVMGTDMHRVSRGDATLGQGIEVVEKKFGGQTVSDFERNGKMILSDRSFEEIIG